MTRVSVGANGRVVCRAVIPLPISPSRAWGELRDFARHASHDAFHAGFHIAGGGPPRRGARLLITHRYAGVTVVRLGRIVRWREYEPNAPRPAGYSFSDCSRRGPRHGFPHVLSYFLRPDGSGACTLEVVVRGRWTARLVPRGIAWVWLRWVFAHVVTSVRNDMLALALPATRQGRRA